MTIIRVQNVVKEFRRPKRKTGLLGGLRTLATRDYVVTRAVDRVSFNVNEGELVAYLGPNGAGKSTTVKMLTGILAPTSGTVEVAGLVPWRHRERNAMHIGVVFGQRSALWWDLPLVESFKLIGKLYDVPARRYNTNLEKLSDLLGLDDFVDTPVRQLSLGQRMRGDLAAAMLYDPRILYLDEPTVGLDVVAKERVLAFLKQLNREARTTVLLTTHDLNEVERLCERIILIDHGRVLYDGSVEGLKSRYAPYHELVVHLTPETVEIPWDLTLPDVELASQADHIVTLRYDPDRVTVSELIGAVTARRRVTDLAIVKPELEGVVHTIYDQRGPA